jgi:quercetin dioxygenase-like cupin family protein
MEERHNESTQQRPEGERPIDSLLVEIDLAAFVKQIKGESSWKNTQRNAITVFKTNGLRIVLIALHEGAGMARHTADGIISVQVLEGRMQFNTDQRSIELSTGKMVALHERLPHSILAIKETIFLLTLTTPLEIKGDHL